MSCRSRSKEYVIQDDANNRFIKLENMKILNIEPIYGVFFDCLNEMVRSVAS